MRRAAFPVPGVIRNVDLQQRSGYRVCCARQQSRPVPGWHALRFTGPRSIAGWTVILRPPPEPEIADFNIREEVESCLALARSTQTLVAAGDRLAAARAAVELVKAYDRVLENIRLVPLSLPEQQHVRDRLTPVAELLRKYRLR